jgi:hypothetical protein
MLAQLHEQLVQLALQRALRQQLKIALPDGVSERWTENESGKTSTACVLLYT